MTPNNQPRAFCLHQNLFFSPFLLSPGHSLFLSQSVPPFCSHPDHTFYHSTPFPDSSLSPPPTPFVEPIPIFLSQHGSGEHSLHLTPWLHRDTPSLLLGLLERAGGPGGGQDLGHCVPARLRPHLRSGPDAWLCLHAEYLDQELEEIWLSYPSDALWGLLSPPWRAAPSPATSSNGVGRKGGMEDALSLY